MRGCSVPTDQRGRRTFGPVVLLGLASAGLTAFASNQTWAAPDASTLGVALPPITPGAQLPLALSLALVLLATWAVLLVLRGRTRRVLAWFGLVTAIAITVTVIIGHSTVPDDVRADYADWAHNIQVHVYGWYWLALAASLTAVVAAVFAVRFVRSWPEMGSKYDAPGTAARPTEPETPLEIWKAIDEGRDPTA